MEEFYSSSCIGVNGGAIWVYPIPSHYYVDNSSVTTWTSGYVASSPARTLDVVKSEMIEIITKGKNIPASLYLEYQKLTDN